MKKQRAMFLTLNHLETQRERTKEQRRRSKTEALGMKYHEIEIFLESSWKNLEIAKPPTQ